MIAGAVATFLVTAVITFFGLRKGRSDAQSPSSTGSTPQTLLGATLMENSSMRELTRALDDHTEELKDNTRALNAATAAYVRMTDLIMFMGKR